MSWINYSQPNLIYAQHFFVSLNGASERIWLKCMAYLVDCQISRSDYDESIVDSFSHEIK